MNTPDTRGSGRTTAQMRAAPPAAIYVTPAYATSWYERELARHLGRHDLLLVPTGMLAQYPDDIIHRALSGRRVVVLDHALPQYPKVYRALQMVKAAGVSIEVWQPPWSSTPPITPGRYRVRCGETDNKPQVLDVQWLPLRAGPELCVLCPDLGRMPVDIYHNGLTSCQWQPV